MKTLGYALVVALGAFMGCAHRPLSASSLEAVRQPAFISRIEDGAGPKSTVFRDDSAYSDRLKKLEAKEADRRLQVKLHSGTGTPGKGDGIPSITRFEIADGLRASTLALLPNHAPWNNVVDPITVASALESFLVEEVPANPPNYELLKPFGADAIIEFVIEDYGMRSDRGRAGVYLVGYGRMFRLDGGGNLWFRSFEVDEVASKIAELDPFVVAKNPQIFRKHMQQLVRTVAELFAKDLMPEGVMAAADSPKGEEGSGKQEIQRKRETIETKPDDPI